VLSYIAIFVPNIYHVRLRYLSVSFQISITFVLDIYQFRIRYHKKQPPLCFYVIVAER